MLKDNIISNIPEEQFKRIKGVDDYYVSNMGRIWSGKTRKYLALTPDDRDYYPTKLRCNGKYVYDRVHRVVAKYFCVKKRGCDVVNHKNGNKHDCRASNLEWTTHLGNSHHAFNTGLMPVGERHYRAKLTNAQVIAIKEALKQNVRTRTLATQYGVSIDIIYEIKVNHRYKYIN